MAASKSRSRSSSSKSPKSSTSRARGGSSSRGDASSRAKSSSGSASRAKSSSGTASRARGGSARSGGGSSSRGGGAAKVTTDHEQIRRWAEERGGRPACVRGTERGESCLLRIDFPGGAGADELAQMEWDEFFEQLDQNNLQFLYQEKTKGGRTSRFNKFVSPETAAAQGSSSRGRGVR